MVLKMSKSDLKWTPTLAELIDRLSIHQLKEVFIVEHKEKYAKEMLDIMHDINILIAEKNVKITAEIVRAIIVLSQINAHIWYNESKARKGESQDLHLLRLTHGINGIRNRAMNFISATIGDSRQDYKIDCLASEFKDWEISLCVGGD